MTDMRYINVDVAPVVPAEVPVTPEHIYGALSRSQEGAGIATSATAIVSGDPSGHWQISNGRLYPSATGVSAGLNAGPYSLALNDSTQVNITIEPDCWDVATQAEWDVIALQSAATLAGKTIALRNDSTLNLGITGASGTPFRRADFRNGATPLTIKGRFGDVGDWASYCEIDKVQSCRGARGLTFKHLKTTAAAESKFLFVGESANHCEDITIDDCWVSGQTADPNGDFSTSTNYPMFNIDLIATTGSIAGTVGNFTVKNCHLLWGDSIVNIGQFKAGASATITDNHVQYFYGDALAVAGVGTAPPTTTISRNFILDTVGLATDSANPHVDAIRLIANNGFTVDWTNITIEDNVIIQGTARGDMQAIFLDDMKTGAGDSGHFFTATIRNNLVAINFSVWGIGVLQAKNCVIDNNTVASWNQTSSNAPGIIIGGTTGTLTNGGNNTVTDNIADGFGTAGGSDTYTNNFNAGLNGGTIAYSTLYDGPTYAPTTRAEAIALFNPKVAAGAVIA